MNEGLRVVDITQKFGGLLALDAVNIAVYPGEIVGIIGPNGAGKTTLFNVISGVYQPTSGHIYLNDQEITNLKPYQISQLGFSRTFQNIRLFTRMNVLENVQMGMCGKAKVSLFDNLFSTPKKRAETIRQRERAIEILRIMGLEDKKYHMPHTHPYANIPKSPPGTGLRRRRLCSAGNHKAQPAAEHCRMSGRAIHSCAALPAAPALAAP